MRVKIGNYVRTTGSMTDILSTVCFWIKKYDDNTEYTSGYERLLSISNWLTTTKTGEDNWVAKMLNWLYSKRTRQIDVHIDPYDVWNMDSTLATIILPMLKEIKRQKHGSPGNMLGFTQTSSGSAQHVFDFYEQTDDVAWDAGHQQWQEILDKMIWAFEQIQPDFDWESQYHEPTNEPIDWCPSLMKSKVDFNGMDAHHKRIQEGLGLFGQYYQSLWT